MAHSVPPGNVDSRPSANVAFKQQPKLAGPIGKRERENWLHRRRGKQFTRSRSRSPIGRGSSSVAASRCSPLPPDLLEDGWAPFQLPASYNGRQQGVPAAEPQSRTDHATFCERSGKQRASCANRPREEGHAPRHSPSAFYLAACIEANASALLEGSIEELRRAVGLCCLVRSPQLAFESAASPGDIATQADSKVVYNPLGQDDTNNDHITIEWTNGAAKQLRRECFNCDGMVRRKNLPIEYNP